MARHSDAEIKKIIKEMTLEEKCSLLSGQDFWRTKTVKRVGVPQIMVSDGPHGLRKQADNAGFNDSIKAVCFPAACATACSFDREVYKKLGDTLADECLEQNVSTILGPAINIKRSPLCGRNFEYISEDPYLAGELSASYINAVQAKKVGTSLKHFALNNQEYRRLTNSSDCDERTMREIYLPAFETAVKKAQPYTVMHSYNLVNGTYSGESKWLLDEVLRKEWGFKGVVMSDWGAVNDRVAGLEAGQDLEMPGTNGIRDKEIAKAVKAKKLDEKLVDKSCERLLKWIFNYVDSRESNKYAGEFNFEKHHKIAYEIAKESIVLLKNDGVLPLKPVSQEEMEQRKKRLLPFGKFKKKEYDIAVIGEFAMNPRIQGGGSSHINADNITNAVSAFEKAGVSVKYAQGYQVKSASEGASDIDTMNLFEQALELAKKSRTVVIFAGLPDSYESEGYDRKHIDLPENQTWLINQISMIAKTVVVLHNGSPVSMPWIDSVDAVVEAYLGGEAIEEAVVDVLLGKVNPSGKLAESFPLKLEDNPSYFNFANNKTNTKYSEGIFVGYRYYDTKKMDVLFPFGHGLSYTEFEYSNLTFSKKNAGDSDKVTVTVTVKNIGQMEGKEVVQLYVSDRTNAVTRPVKELKGFEKVSLKAGASTRVSFVLDKRSFAWYNTDIHDWYAASGQYEILVGSSSRDIRLKDVIEYKSSTEVPFVVTDNVTLGDLIMNEKTRDCILEALGEKKSVLEGGDSSAVEAISAEMQASMKDSDPLRNLMCWNHFSPKEYEQLKKNLIACAEGKVQVKKASAKKASAKKGAVKKAGAKK